MVARLALTALVLLASAALGDDARVVVLTLPHALAAGEEPSVRIDAGVLAKAAAISVHTGDGVYVGTIQPFGIRENQIAGGYTFPLPAGLFHEGRVSLHLSVTQYGAAPRTPTAQEVRGVRLVVGKTVK